MRISKVGLDSRIGRLCIILVSLGFTPTVGATTAFHGLAELSVELISVTTEDGASATEGWSVLADDGYIFDSLTYTYEIGDASATIVPTLIAAQALQVGDSIFQSAEAFGEASEGYSGASLLTEMVVWVANSSDQSLTFTFGYDAAAEASVGGVVADGHDALVDAQLQVFFDRDEPPNVVLLPYAWLVGDILFDSASEQATFMFTLAPGGERGFGALIDAYGYADAPRIVSEPSVLLLVGSGLLGMGFARRHSMT